ncbi:MAG: glutamate mutase epsilon subunit, partial [Acidobacteria bacterium]|nr:glutamate mutase epsilon subunit [Acidobacteriota bacterium]
RTAIFPRAGTGLLEDQISLSKKLVESGVPFIPVTTDSYTRQLDFQKVDNILAEMKKTGRNLLNGYPIINYGVKQTRKIIESVDRGAFNPRLSLKSYPLATEISFAAGMTGIAASSFISWAAYEKDATLEQSLTTNQYVHRLIGYYADRGVIISTDNHGWILTGMQPMTLNLATTIIDALMVAEQGGKSITSVVHLMGNMAQDLAWIRVAPRLMREYLDKFGYKDVAIAGVFAQHTPLFPMPQGMGAAFAFPNYTAMVGALGKVEAVSVRTIDEALGIPTEESHALSYESTNWLLNVIRGQKIELNMKEIDEEAAIAELEIRAILDKVLEVGDGDLMVGCLKSVEAGIMDSCFSPNKQVQDRVLGVKDSRGAIRYLEFGNLPFPEEVKKFHREKVREREKSEGRKMDYEVVVQDFWAFSKGQLVGKA